MICKNCEREIIEGFGCECSTNDSRTKEALVTIGIEKYRRIMDLLKQAMHPKVTFTEDLETMKKEATENSYKAIQEAYTVLKIN